MKSESRQNSRQAVRIRGTSSIGLLAIGLLLIGVYFAAVSSPAPAVADDADLPVPRVENGLPIPASADDDRLPLPGGPPPPPGDELPAAADDLPLPPPPGSDGAPTDTGEYGLDDETVDLPLFGKVNSNDIGMPAFTIAIGLVDGFNPCAMWVLLFLLSLLANLKSRLKMFIIAGIFVLVSGLAYFAFMAAWLKVFLLAGYLDEVQIALGVLAVVVGSIHVKDFFAFKKGVSLSIPESAKPGIYARVRQIINAETLWAAMIGATVLAVLVNIIELLCTAGLPALYTKVLMMQGYPAWKNYAFIGLYNLAYMFDDSVMVVIAVATLGRRKLQEKEGRWLKLVSGALILALGIIMLTKPELLEWKAG